MVLARRVGADGRTRAYLNGRSANVGDLRELGGALLAFYGQHEHRKLTLPPPSWRSSTACAGDTRGRLRSARWPYARCAGWRAAGGAARAAAHARARAGAARVRARRDRGGRAGGAEHERLLARASACAASTRCARPRRAAAEALAGDDGRRSGARPSCWLAAGQLDALAGVDPALDALAERLHAVVIEAQDLAAELRDYWRRGCRGPRRRARELGPEVSLE